MRLNSLKNWNNKLIFLPTNRLPMKTLWCKNQENPSDRISHAWAPLKYESPSYFSIANYAVNLDSCGDIHCALGPPLAIENRRNWGVFNTIAQFTNTRSIHCAFYQWRMIDDNKKRFIPHLAIESKLFHSAFVNPCMTIKKVHSAFGNRIQTFS